VNLCSRIRLILKNEQCGGGSMNEFMRGVAVRNLSLKLLFGALPALGCGDGGDLTNPSTGGLEITTITSGPEPDADGYAISVDQGAEVAIGVNATLHRENVQPGSHSVQLVGMAANCTVAGDNPRTVTVSVSVVATVGFTITCAPTTGTVRVTASTSGPSPDPDGYTVTLNGTDRGSLAATGEVTLDGVAPGSHQIGLSGVAANCQAQSNPQTVTVTAGTTIIASFTVSCVTPPPTTGTIAVSTATTGSQLDPDGYTVSLDGGTGQTIGLNATLMISAVAPGAHPVALAGLATNCRVDGQNPRSVTVTAGETATAAFSIVCSAPHLSKIAFVREIPFMVPAIYVMNADGTGQIGLTNSGGGIMSAAWSPDGSKIAFAEYTDPLFDIVVINADGTGRTNITNTTGAEIDPDWSPDGKKIAFSTGGLGAEISVMNADGSGVMQLTNPGEFVSDFSPNWSPDGRKIAFTRITQDLAGPSSGREEVYVMNADGTDLRVLMENGRDPDWSPDGRTIVFSSGRAATRDRPYIDIYVMNADGTGATRLTNSIDGMEPAWSPDGRMIAFTEDRGGNIYVMNADGSGQTNLTNNAGGEIRDWGPTWSP
jgi:TolB protein